MTPPRTKHTVSAAIVRRRTSAGERYPMFTARDVSADGAFLAGPLLLEPGEELELELESSGGIQVRGHAQVTRVAGGKTPGMFIRFTELSQTATSKLVALVAEGA